MTLKAERWWADKGAPVMAQAYLLMSLSPAEWPAGHALRTLAAFAAAFVGIAGLGHLLNDLFDRDADRAAGKFNLLAGASPARIAAWLAGMSTLSTVPWFALPTPPWGLGLVVLQVLLLAAYAAPPLRLKERPWLGIVTDALYAYTVPAGITWATFHGERPWHVGDVGVLLVLVAWSVAAGLRGILLHQIQDAGPDETAGLRTFVTQHGIPRAVDLLARASLPVEVVAFAIAWTAGLGHPAFAAATCAVFAWWCVRQLRQWGLLAPGLPNSPRATVELLSWAVFGEFYTRWVPVFALAVAIARAPHLWPLAVAHALAFPTVLHLLATFLGRQCWTQARRLARLARA